MRTMKPEDLTHPEWIRPTPQTLTSPHVRLALLQVVASLAIGATLWAIGHGFLGAAISSFAVGGVVGTLLHKNINPKQVHTALRNLIRKDWQSNTNGTTDAEDRSSFRGFNGLQPINSPRVNAAIRADHPCGAELQQTTAAPDREVADMAHGQIVVVNVSASMPHS
jgi:hypothetical protein